MTCTLFLLHPYRVAARSNIHSSDFIRRKETHAYCGDVTVSVIDWICTLPDPRVNLTINCQFVKTCEKVCIVSFILEK
jgi:hypothetical protein